MSFGILTPECSISGLKVIQASESYDARGSFSELYRHSSFCALGVSDVFVQDNFSVSASGVVRGLHYQRKPKAQAKLVRVILGRGWSVAVDLRSGSGSLGRWFGIELSRANRLMLYIPEGFAHGFASFEDGTMLHYKCSNEYDPVLESGIRWDDPALAVDWPVEERIVSERDKALPLWDGQGVCTRDLGSGVRDEVIR